MIKNSLTEAAVLDALRQVMDPEIGCNIVDLGLIYGIAIEDGDVRITMTLTTPGCPMHESISAGAQMAVLGLEDVNDVNVELIWEPPWHPGRMTEAGRAMIGVKDF